MRRTGPVRGTGLSVLRSAGREAGSAGMERLEDRIAAAAGELQAIRDELAGLARLAVREEPVEAPPVLPRLLTVPQAATALGLGESTVHGLIRRGLLGSRKVGSARRIPVEDLDAFVSRLPSASRGA